MKLKNYSLSIDLTINDLIKIMKIGKTKSFEELYKLLRINEINHN